jgi:hypothetical protein
MLFRRRFSRLLTSPPGQQYISGVVKRRDSSPEVAIQHDAEKGNSYPAKGGDNSGKINQTGLGLGQFKREEQK